MTHRSEIDGLRGVAVIAVLLFHTKHPYFRSGFIGVEMFFVISGFLITQVLITAHTQNSFSFADFYLRRARRLLPALFTMVLACIPFAWLWMFSRQFDDFSQSLVSTVLFGSNILFWLESQNYFALSSSLKPLLHTWSLSLEEQFYLVYPAFFAILCNRNSRFRFWGILVLTLLSWVYAVFFIQNHLTEHYMLHARVWLFGLGALAYLCREKIVITGFTNTQAGFALLGLLGISIALLLPALQVIIPEISYMKSMAVNLSAFAVVMVLIFSQPNNLAGRILSNSLLVKLGIISYSLYLWHYPIFVFARHRLHELSTVSYLWLTTLSIILAFLSWRFIESPFRKTSVVSTRKFLVLASTFGALILTIGAYGVLNKGYVIGMTKDELAMNINYGLEDDCAFYKNKPKCKTSDQPDILVWGDSFAMHIVGGILLTGKDVQLMQLTKSRCSPLIHQRALVDTEAIRSGDQRARDQHPCYLFNQQVLSSIDEWPSLKYAVVSSRFSNYFKRFNGVEISQAVKEAAIDNVYSKLFNTLELLKSKNISPVVFSEPPHPSEHKVYCAMHALKFQDDPEPCNFHKLNLDNSQLMSDDLLRRIDQHFDVVWLDDYLCSSGVCRTTIEATNVYTLGGHLSINGTSLIGSKLDFYSRIKKAN